ncbi:MAG: hypothetical protein IJ454_01590, partial [Clostridia bacterium]|nr:hypothetical protein [Clostridia bacterium]
DADENDPASYDFAFTDWLLNAITKQNTKIIYRLGPTIENYHYIKAYHIYPPKDYEKWARICEKIIAHYNEGWADGYHLGIEYWEIWNEPDAAPDIKDNPMWKGTFDEYMELYKVTSLHLKEKYPHIKVGGYACSGFWSLFPEDSNPRRENYIKCFKDFLEFAEENKLPFDFFSWHSYCSADKNLIAARYVSDNLKKHGFDNTEIILDEWNPDINLNLRGTLEDSSNVAQMLLKLHNSPVDKMAYYDGQINGRYQGLFNPITFEPFKTYYVFKAFNELYKLGNEATVTDIPEGISCLAATDGDKKAAMLTNKGDKSSINIEADFPGAFKLYRLNDNMNLEQTCLIKANHNIEADKFETILLVSD